MCLYNKRERSRNQDVIIESPKKLKNHGVPNLIIQSLWHDQWKTPTLDESKKFKIFDYNEAYITERYEAEWKWKLSVLQNTPFSGREINDET